MTNSELALRWLSTAAFLAVAGYGVARLAAAHQAGPRYPGEHRALDVAHLLMGLGMAAMASPVGGPLPLAGWQAIFLVLTAWFAGSWWRRRRAGPPAATGWHRGWHSGGAHHAVAGLAMLYMLTAMPHHDGQPSAPWLSGHLVPGLALPPLGWALAGYFLVAAAVLVATTSWRAGPGRSILHAPRLTATCEVTMALGNGYLLVIMLAA